MLYSDRNIRAALATGDLTIEGLREGAIQPASVDVHLSDRPFKVWARSGLVRIESGEFNAWDANQTSPPIQPWSDQSGEMVELSFDSHGHIRLLPGQFALASTIERFEIGRKVAGRLEGKSSLARLGLIVHTTAGFFDPGFEGYATLELLNVSPRPMLLRPEMPIAQMAFFEMLSTPEHLYNGKYQGQGADPEPSHYDRNFTTE